MVHHAIHPGAQPRRGVVLIAVLVVVALLSLAAYQFSELMLAEYKATVSYTRSVQARAAADSGLNYTAMLLSDPNLMQSVLNGNPYNNPSVFQAISVGGEGPNQVFFSVVAPLGPDDDPSTTVPFYYGAVDESGKLNLNALLKLDSSGDLAVQILKKLNIPEETANAIVDWLDPDDKPRSGGAENDTYSAMGYLARNGPLDTLEELLYVKGSQPVTPELLFGNDLNRNGMLDGDEQATGAQRDLGWQAYLTVYSREQNVDGTGNPRTYINAPDTTKLYTQLPDIIGQDMTNYILAYRRFGPAPADMPQNMAQPQPQPQAPAAQPAQPPAQRGQPAAAQPGQPPQPAAPQPPPPANGTASGITKDQLQLNTSNGGNNIASLFELLGTSVLIKNPQNPMDPGVKVACPLNDTSQARDILPKMLDKLTTSTDQDVPARVNVNTAPSLVLQALPGLADSDVKAILGARPNPSSVAAPDAIFQTPAWLYTEANLKPDVLKTVERFITARTQAYRVQVVGHFAGPGPTVRLEAVIDTNRGRPRIVYWRDLSELGRGFNVGKN